jgi:DNA-binding Lrp family transcriptional regulator
MTDDDLERRFINRYQGGFPLVEQPFRAVASDLGCTEDMLLDMIRHLLGIGTLSRFGPLFDAAKLGGGLTLAAMRVPDQDFERITVLINAFDEVAHNYRREHALNMWFVLATDTPEAIESTLAAISLATGLEVYNFPKQREFYIGLWLLLNDDDRVSTVPLPAADTCVAADVSQLDEIDRRIISLTQNGLPLVPHPYGDIADNAACTSQQVKQRLRSMLCSGAIRRIGAVPNHYRLGLRANGMTVWDVTDQHALDLGEHVGRLDFVSHCYLRPRHPSVWRYNLFAMVHGHDRDEVNAKTAHIAALLGDECRAHETLFSSAILKKTGMRLVA